MKIRVDGLMLLILLVLTGGAFAYFKRKDIVESVVESVDPTSQDNLINQGAESLVGTEILQAGFTPFFKIYDWATD